MPFDFYRVRANDQSTFIIHVKFLDEEGELVVPNSSTLKWTLMDDAGNIINSRDQVSVTSDSEIDIVLFGDDLKASDGLKRVVLVECLYNSDLGTNLPLKDQAQFMIDDLTGV